jgi:two-component system sensor histidine kinase MprB
VSLAKRIAILTSLAVGLTLAVASVAVYLTLRSELQSSLDESLLQRAHTTAETTALANAADPDIPRWILAATDVRLAIVDEQGRLSGSNDNDQAASLYLGDPEISVARGEQQSSIRTVSIGTTRYRVVAVPLTSTQALVLAQSMEPTNDSLRQLAFIAWAVGLTGVALAGLAGWAVATNGLRPVRRLTGAAERIARTDDLTAIEVTGDDELARLTVAFNTMLASLAASRRRQSQLVADAGHELRTPLTSLRTNLELLTQADRSGGLPPDARADLLADVRAQIDELSTLVGDLVELARDEPMARNPEPVDLAEVVEAAAARVRRRAPAGTDIAVTAEPWLVIGEPVLLERAVTNLLDNAVKWGPPAGRIDVELRGGRLTVRDRGPGIDAQDLPHVFDRFYRSAEARTMPGSGLGLAIVRRTADRHGGTTVASNAPDGGAVLTLSLPGRPT